MIRKNTAIYLALILGFALQAGGLAGCGDAGDRHVENAKGHEDHGHEAGIEMTDHERGELGIELLTAAPGVIGRTIELPGEIVLNADRVAHVTPRIGGIVREIRKDLGDDVTEGEIVAVIESRGLADATAEYLASRERLDMALTVFDREEALWKKMISSEQEYLNAERELMEARIAKRAAEQKLLALGFSLDALDRLPAQSGPNLTRHEVRAPAAGTIIHKRIGLGESLEEDAEIYISADLGTVWVDINVYQDDLPFVRAGQRISIAVVGGGPAVESVIDYVGPILGEETRTALARVMLPNPERRLRPGTFVTATVFLDDIAAPVVISRDAVQVLNGEAVVFVWTGSGFEAGDVTTGRSSGGWIEIISGLEPGQRYASAGAFNLKAMLVAGSLDSHAGHGH